MSGAEGLLAALGIGAAEAAGGAGAAGAAGAGAGAAGSAAAAAPALTGLGGMGLETAMGAAPAFSSEALPTGMAMAAQRAGEMGIPAYANAMTPNAGMSGAGGFQPPSGKGGGGDMLKGLGKGLGEGATTDAALRLMQMAAASRPTQPGAPPSMQRQQGRGTQPSVQQFLQSLAQRQAPSLRMGG